MEILIVLVFVITLLLPIMFALGIILLIIGMVKQRKKTIRLGLLFSVGSFLVLTSALYYKYGLGKIAPKLVASDFVGDYKLVNSTGEKVQLHLYENRKFETSDILEGYLCEKGRYHVYDNEVWFTCGNADLAAKIHRGIFGFKLKFNANTPKDEAQYVLEKINK